ncbi:receptor-like protein EIX2 [Cornus florida]|uniref:receptor-like protein EIX2 n=1 Tax=Cornus florida TaxID=4283 RepID=UPI00289E4893|nr:receptor-like protein EIX2 [Cornus florida]
MVIMANRSSLPLVATYFIGFLCLGSIGYIMGGSLPSVQCMESEQEALLRFKEGLVDRSDRLSSWVVEEEADCCKWRGVECNHTTGHVMALDLHSQTPNESLQGELTYSALLDLPYLTYLDLSLNHFDRNEIPQSIGSLRNLKYLNLSDANCRGNIPSDLGNLSRLHSLDLSSSTYHSLRANSLDWLQGLSSLKVLDLGGVDLSNAVNWLNAINMLPSLVELHLFACNLNNLPSSLPHVNFTSLEILDLSLNSFNSPIPLWLFDISHSLVHLNLTRNQLQGPIPDAFVNMTSLAVLDLSQNNLEGGVPTSLGLIQEGNQLKGPSSLRELHLSKNRLNGTLVQSLGLLSKLVVFDVAENSLSGVITEAHFSNLSSLRVLDLSLNSFVFNMSSTWIPTFRLDIIRLKSCHLGSLFPKWLQTQNDFSYIDISEAGISDTMPNWFWNLSTLVEHMNVSLNQLKGKVPNLSSKLNLSHLDLSYNIFDGPLPSFSAKMVSLVLAQNSFFGPISGICESLMVTKSSLSTLDLSENNLSGKLPDCWAYGQNLFFMDLSFNQIYGRIPDSIGGLPLMALHLRNNSLYGKLPLSLKNCTTLVSLDLSVNRLFGSIPAWVGESLPYLSFLSLSSNNFSGSIPLQLCQLSSLKILDLSANYLSGEIPRCINNIRGMAMTEYDPYTAQGEDMLKLFERRRFEQFYNWSCVIDLSSNNLSGEIPKEVTSLIGLEVLRLSKNNLKGVIPVQLCQLQSLKVLDLSWNHISGTIPPCINNIMGMTRFGNDEFIDLREGTFCDRTRMISVYYLYEIDLSSNNLSGVIPRGVTSLTMLRALNLSNNHLTGAIPRNIGAMSGIQLLDLSRNKLSCSIPTSITELSFLALLDVSHNNLSGKIPSGSRMNTFDETSFLENPNLCGHPSTNDCLHNETYEDALCTSLEEGGKENEVNQDDDDDWLDTTSFYISMAVGFVTSYCGFWGALLCNSSWRHAYFKFLGNLYDKIYVTVAVSVNKLRRKYQSKHA